MQGAGTTTTTERVTDRFSVTDAARDAAARLRRSKGLHVLLVSWPAGVAYMPAAAFRAGAFDRIIAHVENCPVYADIRQLEAYPVKVVLDAVRGGTASRPRLRIHRG